MLRIFPVLALVFCVMAAFTVVNENYDYYPTLARLLGKDAADFTNLPALQKIRDQVRKTGKLPTHGETIAVTIPPHLSKFQAQQAYVYLPPIWFHNLEPQLPVIELIAGVPGQTVGLDPGRLRRHHRIGLRRPAPRRGATAGHPRQQRGQD